MKDYQQTLARFLDLVKNKKRDKTMMAVIVDSPWMPGYMQMNTLDFYFDQSVWLRAYIKLVEDLPGVVFVPGSWVEFGMATEPSGWGVAIQWSRLEPPSLRQHPGGLSALIEMETPNPEKEGLMPLILRQYERTRPFLKKEGIAPRIAAARGPLTVASHLIGVTELLMVSQLEPKNCHALLNKTTELCINWLCAQLKRMDEPIGVLVLDDIVGMMGPEDAEKFALPFLREIFNNFPDLIHIFHNDTPNEKIFEGLRTINIDVFNFSFDVEVERARELLGPDIVLMGNIPPVDILVRGTNKQVRQSTEEVLTKVEEYGPMLISCGGGVSPGTPIKNLQTMAEIVNSAKPFKQIS